ncbi:TlpA disulfide reductase family protein [Virgibacillus proomii]|uniref:TlpA disulfide reductase family protein n=1 Tax=Virgibacillus proomii TaxID=84407 RepID=UPI001C0F59DC|nr:TlpA disulfide reductase family protein [Virgibacillus proomii]MBU5266371.1 TlpA family protein disulfide reductase [Virgibacillus proomii]
MYKKILGVAIIVVLAGIVLFNYVQKKEESVLDTPNSNISDEMNAKGGMITSKKKGETLEVGNPASDFELNTLSGDKLTLTDLRGKKVILNFWATWCPPCREEMPEMEKFYNDVKSDVEIVAVNLTNSEKNEEDVKEYMDKYGYTYPIPLDVKGKVRNTYQVIAVPTTYFIDEEGKIIKIHPGPMNYELMKEAIEAM